MALYNVEVIEKLSRVVEQEADSYEIAEELIATKYADEEIVLDWEDLEYTKYKPYPSQELVEYFNVNIKYDSKNKLLNFSNKYDSIATYDCKIQEDFNNALNDFLEDYIELEDVKAEKIWRYKNEESLLRTSYGIDKTDLLMYKANNCLAQEHSRIYQTTVDRYKDSEDLYNDYFANKK